MIDTPPPLNLSQRIAAQAQAAVAWVRRVSFFIKLVLVAGGAFISGLAKVLPLATTPFDFKDFVGAVGLVAVFLGAVAVLFLDKSLADSLKLAADAAVELEAVKATKDAELQRVRSAAVELERPFRDVEARYARSLALREVMGALRDGVEQGLSSDGLDVAATAKRLLDLALNQLQAAMDIEPGEMWTVSIYRLDADAKPILRRLATRRSNRAEETLASREWRPGEGHIGKAFQMPAGVVLEDVNDPGMRHLLQTPKAKDLPDDAERYRSVAAIPVFPFGADQPWGVVIATSAVAGRFSPTSGSAGSERAEAMRSLAGMIALAVATHHTVSRHAPAAAAPK